MFPNDPEKQRSLIGSSIQKCSRFRFKFFEPEPGLGSFAEILSQFHSFLRSRLSFFLWSPGTYCSTDIFVAKIFLSMYLKASSKCQTVSFGLVSLLLLAFRRYNTPNFDRFRWQKILSPFYLGFHLKNQSTLHLSWLLAEKREIVVVLDKDMIANKALEVLLALIYSGETIKPKCNSIL